MMEIFTSKKRAAMIVEERKMKRGMKRRPSGNPNEGEAHTSEKEESGNVNGLSGLEEGRRVKRVAVETAMDTASMESNYTRSKEEELRFCESRVVTELNYDQQTLTFFLSSRYNFVTKALDLSKVNKDSTLRQYGLAHCLQQQKYHDLIKDIIKEKIPHLEILDLSQNRIKNMILIRKISEVAPKVRALNLEDNELKSTSINSLSSFAELTEINLKNTSFYDSFDDRSVYKKAVLKILPNIEFLDGSRLASDQEQSHHQPNPQYQDGTQMVLQLCHCSGMNESFSRMCLEECDWDFDRAVKAFHSARQAGKLPEAAFIREK